MGFNGQDFQLICLKKACFTCWCRLWEQLVKFEKTKMYHKWILYNWRTCSLQISTNCQWVSDQGCKFYWRPPAPKGIASFAGVRSSSRDLPVTSVEGKNFLLFSVIREQRLANGINHTWSVIFLRCRYLLARAIEIHEHMIMTTDCVSFLNRFRSIVSNFARDRFQITSEQAIKS